MRGGERGSAMSPVMVAVNSEAGERQKLDYAVVSPDSPIPCAASTTPRKGPKLSHRVQATRNPSELVNPKSVEETTPVMSSAVIAVRQRSVVTPAKPTKANFPRRLKKRRS